MLLRSKGGGQINSGFHARMHERGDVRPGNRAGDKDAGKGDGREERLIAQRIPLICSAEKVIVDSSAGT